MPLLVQNLAVKWVFKPAVMSRSGVVLEHREYQVTGYLLRYKNELYMKKLILMYLKKT